MIFVDGSQLPGKMIGILAFVGKSLTNLSGADRNSASLHISSVL